MLLSIIQAVVLVLFPALVIWAEKRNRVVEWLSPVIVCYGVGILVANLPFVPIDEKVSTTMTEVAVPLAIPLLLFSTDFLGWLRLAPKTVFAFFLAVFSVVFSTSTGAYIFADKVERLPDLAGMLIGVYTGGTPNMSAIGLALEVPNELFVLLNAADVIICSVYLFFLMSVAQRVLLKFMPAFQPREEDAEACEHDDVLSGDSLIELHKIEILKQLALALGAAILAGALGVGTSFLLAGGISVAIVMLAITTYGILGSFVPKIRNLDGSYALGQYLMLVFCVSIGTLADLEKLLQAPGAILAFTGWAVYVAVLTHIALCALFRVDADTTIITSTAAVFGPAFVGPIAGVLRNKEIVVSGLTTGLVGYAVGNYIGLAVAHLLR